MRVAPRVLRIRMDCPVCFRDLNEANIAWLLPCRHVFCRSCAQQLLLRHHGACGICRGDIAGTQTNDAAEKFSDSETVVIVSFQDKKHAGITVRTRTVKGQPVPVIATLQSGDACFESKLRVGDRVRRINGFDVDKCEQVTSLADACAKNEVDMTMVIDKRRRMSRMMCFISRFV